MSANGLGQRIKMARGKLKISQRELGRRVKISSAYMSFIEQGKRQPTLKLVAVIAEALGVTPGFLAYGKEK